MIVRRDCGCLLFVGLCHTRLPVCADINFEQLLSTTKGIVQPLTLCRAVLLILITCFKDILRSSVLPIFSLVPTFPRLPHIRVSNLKIMGRQVTQYLSKQSKISNIVTWSWRWCIVQRPGISPAWSALWSVNNCAAVSFSNSLHGN